MLTTNKAVYGTDGSLKTLKDMSGGSDPQLIERVSSLENDVSGLGNDIDNIGNDIDNIGNDIDNIDNDIDNIDNDISNIKTTITAIKNYINNPAYSEQVLCYAEGPSGRTKVTNPGRIGYVYEIDKSSGIKVLSSNMFFVKGGYIGNTDVIIEMTKGTVKASFYGNPDNMFTFQVQLSEEPENLNIVYLCGTIANIN